MPITVSGVVLLIAAGSMPALPALALVGGLGAATVLLRFGVGEQLACRALHGARSPTAAEAAVMAPAITRACAAGLGPPLVRLAVQPHGQGLVAFACGGSTVVAPRDLVVAVHHGRVTHEQAAASIAHAAAICSAGLTRGQVALAVWCLPWVVLEGVVAAAGRTLRGVALLRMAWRARVVVAGIAVAQNAADGHPWMAALLVVLIGATYAQPALTRHWHRRLALVGDDTLAEHGLGGHYAGLLALSGHRVDLERHARLTRPRDTDRTGGVVLSLT
ncbi:hypothetical protein GCM10023153_07120 [Ornithinibacter aureus]|uniref:Peptidase M48 domain-containing protein n=1 Tax=Ornithinibacter aureus TaxID=622664 RepID=A0ABP8JG30_9MICO